MRRTRVRSTGTSLAPVCHCTRKNEEAFEAPIASVSLGLPVIFPFGGMHRVDTTRRMPLTHGDVVVWGGAARLRYHGVLPPEGGQHPLMGGYRINLTLRKAL